MTFRGDTLRVKATRTGITMDEFTELLGIGLDSRRRRYATMMNGRMQFTKPKPAKPVWETPEFIAENKAIGLKAAEDSPAYQELLRAEKNFEYVQAFAGTDLILDLRRRGWKEADIGLFLGAEKRIARRVARDRKRKVEAADVQSSHPSAILSDMFRFHPTQSRGAMYLPRHRVKQFDSKKKTRFVRDEEKSLIYPAEDAERRRREIEDALAALLLLYLYEELSREDALAAADKILEGFQKIVVSDINEWFASRGQAGQLRPSDERLAKNLDRLKAEFIRALNTKDDYWSSSEGRKQSAGLIAVLLTYATIGIITESVAKVSGALWLKWRSKGDLEVCPVCEELDGQLFDPLGPLPGTPGEIHENCCCRWELVFEEA